MFLISLRSDFILASTSAIARQSFSHSLAWIKHHNASVVGTSIFTLFVYAVLALIGIVVANTLIPQLAVQPLLDHFSLVQGLSITLVLACATIGVSSGTPMPALTSIFLCTLLNFQLAGYLYLISVIAILTLVVLAVEKNVCCNVEQKQAKTMAKLKNQAKNGRWFLYSTPLPDVQLNSSTGVKMRISLQLAVMTPVLLALGAFKMLSSAITPHFLAYMTATEVTVFSTIFAFCLTTLLCLAANSSYDSLRPLFRLPPRVAK